MALPNRRMGHLDESGVVPAAPCAQCDTHGFKIREESGRFLKVMAIHVTLLFLSTLFFTFKKWFRLLYFLYIENKKLKRQVGTPLASIHFLLLPI